MAGLGAADYDSAHTVVEDTGYAPFGEAYDGNANGWFQFTSNGMWTITGSNNSGLDDFMYRRYSSTQSRWISPDPAGLAAVDPSNPQTWNRYAYVGNNPMTSVDPTGLEPDLSSWGTCIDAYNGCTPLCDPYIDPQDCPSTNATPVQVPNETVTVTASFLNLADDSVAVLIADSRVGGGSNGNGSGGNAPNNAQQGKPCTNVPQSPPGASATSNTNLVKQEVQGMSPATKLYYFDLVFQTGGTFDYKASGDQYMDYGNWNFGYVCAANYRPTFCQSTAGMNRMYRAAKQHHNPFGSGVPFIKPPYGDQSGDNQQIRSGIQASQSGCIQ